MVLAGLAAVVAAAETAETVTAPVPLSPVVVTATRTAQGVDTLPVAVDIFTRVDLRTSPALAVDDALRASPAFGLFRRTGSLTANPTAQGVSLRGLGPSGASRSLVLLDGVPLNDPFGGWVAWTKLPKLSLAGAEIVRGGGSGTWGNAALGGTVQLLTDPATADRTEIEGGVGDFDTRSGEIALTRTGAGGRSAISVDAAAFATDGVYLLRDPGAIDRPADLDYQRVQATWRTALGATTDLAVTGRAYAEDRGNGTPLQRNASSEQFLSATLSGQPGRAASVSEWTASGYFQTQAFESGFSSVNAARTAETPASDQYDVPATAAGGAFTATWGEAGDDARTTAGADLRWVDGETREAFGWNGAAFASRRQAGGEQTFLGTFVRHERVFAPGWRGSLGARVDYWRNGDGHRREFAAATGAVTRDDHYASEDGVEFSPQLGLVWQATPAVRARASVYQAFRVPTLNEYYRPFRVGAVSTEANAALEPETLAGGELGFDLGRPDARAGLSVTAFVNELDHAVTNVTLAPNTRQRRNLDHVRVQGLEVSAHARPEPSLTLEAAYLFSDARVTDPGAAAASLDGSRLAQVPRHTLTAGLRWTAPVALGSLEWSIRARWLSAQFEDDENTLVLGAVTTVDLGLSRRFGRGWEVFMAVENLLDAAVETGRTAAGVVNIGPPRWTHGGVRWQW